MDKCHWKQSGWGITVGQVGGIVGRPTKEKPSWTLTISKFQPKRFRWEGATRGPNLLGANDNVPETICRWRVITLWLTGRMGERVPIPCSGWKITTQGVKRRWPGMGVNKKLFVCFFIRRFPGVSILRYINISILIKYSSFQLIL